MIRYTRCTLATRHPRALADVTHKHRDFAIDDGRDIDVTFGANDFAENIATSVRRGVIDGDVFKGRRNRRIDGLVGHAFADGGCIDETHRVSMVFHIIGRGLAQDDIGIDFAYRRAEAHQRFAVVIDVEVVDEGFVIADAEEFRRCARFVATRLDRLFATHCRRTPGAVRDPS